MKKIGCLFFFTFLLFEKSGAQSAFIDSLMNQLNIVPKDTGWIKKADVIFQVIIESNIDAADSLNKEILSVALHLNSLKGKAIAYKEKGDLCWHRLQFEFAKLFLDSALAMCEEIKDKETKAAVFTSMGINYIINRQESKGVEMLYKSLELIENSDKYLTALNYENIGLVNERLGDIKKSVSYHEKALALFRALDDKNKIALVLNNYGVAVTLDKRIPEAIKILNEGAALSEEIKNNYFLTGFYEALGTCYLKLDTGNEISANSTRDSLLNKSLFYYRKAEKVINAHGYYENLANIKFHIGEVYSRLGDEKAAIRYTKEAVFYSKKFSILNILADANRLLYEIYFSKNDYKAALDFHVQYKEWNDSMYFSQKGADIERLHSAFETEKKDIQITLLNKDKILQQKEIEKQKVTRNSFIIGFILVLLLVGITYNRYRLKQKANRQLSQTLSELKHTQAQLVESEKMAAFGVMASRVAHEIQNPLNFVKNFSELAEDNVKEIKLLKGEEEKKAATDQLIQNLQKIHHHATRADKIVKELQEHIRAGTTHEFFGENKT